MKAEMCSDIRETSTCHMLARIRRTENGKTHKSTATMIKSRTYESEIDETHVELDIKLENGDTFSIEYWFKGEVKE